jgi:hypothetical protein
LYFKLKINKLKTINKLRKLNNFKFILSLSTFKNNLNSLF